jgi:hypothetical protein
VRGRAGTAGRHTQPAVFLLLIFVAAAAAAQPPAITVEEGSVARRQVVALGRDLVVAGEAMADVAVVAGSLAIRGEVGGDAIVLGGDAVVGNRGRVEGDVFVLGGSLRLEPGAAVGGRTVAYPTVAAAWLTLLEGPTLGLSPFSPLILGLKLALLAAWLVVVLLCLGGAGREALATSEAVRGEPFRAFLVGLTGVLALTLTAVFLASLVPSLAGLPLLGLAVLIALMLKLWGMVAVFHAVGHGLLRRVLRRRPSPLDAAIAGLMVLGALKLVPWVGAWVWTTATLVGVGAALTTRLGRREPWFEAGDLDRLASLSRS